MCTTPRQLLPSVFGNNVYPRGLKRTLKLLTCPATADHGAETVMDFSLLSSVWEVKQTAFIEVLPKDSLWMCAQVQTSVHAQIAADQSLSKTPTHSNFFFMTWKLCSAMLYCRKLPRPSVILPMKVNRLCAWTRSKFLMLPLPLHIDGVQCQYRQIYAAYSSLSAVCQSSPYYQQLCAALKWPQIYIFKHPEHHGLICWSSRVTNDKNTKSTTWCEICSTEDWITSV